MNVRLIPLELIISRSYSIVYSTLSISLIEAFWWSVFEIFRLFVGLEGWASWKVQLSTRHQVSRFPPPSKFRCPLFGGTNLTPRSMCRAEIKADRIITSLRQSMTDTHEFASFKKLCRAINFPAGANGWAQRTFWVSNLSSFAKAVFCMKWGKRGKVRESFHSITPVGRECSGDLKPSRASPVAQRLTRRVTDRRGRGSSPVGHSEQRKQKWVRLLRNNLPIYLSTS